jgi:hypothetical protein
MKVLEMNERSYWFQLFEITPTGNLTVGGRRLLTHNEVADYNHSLKVRNANQRYLPVN